MGTSGNNAALGHASQLLFSANVHKKRVKSFTGVLLSMSETAGDPANQERVPQGPTVGSSSERFSGTHPLQTEGSREETL